MRNRSVTLVAASLATLFAAGCAVAPAPPPGNPAPALPADSIAYDQLPAGKARPNLFPGNCSPFETKPELAKILDMAGEPSFDPSMKSCLFKVGDGALVVIHGVDPDAKNPDPWQDVWMAETPSNSHFRRELVLDRYYAVTSVRLSGCEIIVNTGSPGAISLATLHQNAPMSGDSVEDDRKRSEEYCPAVRKLVSDYLTVVDPGGGSLAK